MKNESAFHLFSIADDLSIVLEKIESYLVDTHAEFDSKGGEVTISIEAEEEIRILLKEGALVSKTVQQFSNVPISSTEILLLFPESMPIESSKKLESLDKFLTDLEKQFTNREYELINSTMPLMNEFSAKLQGTELSDFALVWRDHFLEENIPLLEGFERAGIDPEWIMALSKGDNTEKPERIKAHFDAKGYSTGILDSAYSESHYKDTTTRISTFVARANSARKKVFLVDDGGIICTCFNRDQQKFVFGVEVTVVGRKRIKELDSLDIPIFDVGQSELKRIITYPEIADSGVKRVRELIPSEKLSGRAVLVLGYGTVGKLVAKRFRDIGCRVSVVDIDYYALIEAAESGFPTFRSSSEAIAETSPILVYGCSGEVSMGDDAYDALPDMAYVTAIATKDLSRLEVNAEGYSMSQLPNVGNLYVSKSGKRFIQLGDGRSMNLFLSEAIPNKANDVFKTAILISALELAKSYHALQGGLYVEKANQAIEKSGILEKYYERYLVP